MSYRDAVEDGISVIKLKSGDSMYCVKCHICGDTIKSLNYRRGVQYTCKKCKLEQSLADKEHREIVSWEGKERKFQNAVKRIEDVRPGLKEYQRAIDIIHGKLHRDGWFQSTEEILVAIELVKNKVKARHQVKLGRYRADFVLPEEKVVLEVDGVLFHAQEDPNKRQMRDNLITLALGANWEIVHVTDQMVNENITRLLPAIRKVKEHRKLLRDQNGGILPEWYNNKAI